MNQKFSGSPVSLEQDTELQCRVAIKATTLQLLTDLEPGYGQLGPMEFDTQGTESFNILVPRPRPESLDQAGER